MISHGSIIIGPAVLGSDPEAVGPFTNLFIIYRVLIWDNIVAIFHVLYTWTYLKTSKKYCDGRMVYKPIYNHYLGPSNIDHMADFADKKLSQCTYTGEKRNWTFKKYATLHKEHHNILESLKDHGYTGINQKSKVGYLSKGINTTSLDSVKTRIISDESLRQDFEGCVTLYKDFFKKLSADDRQLLDIAASITNNASGNKSVTFPPEYRYYDSNE